jgi:hypothetical protein
MTRVTARAGFVVETTGNRLLMVSEIRIAAVKCGEWISANISKRSLKKLA